MNNKQISETEWADDNGTCKIKIEINGDLTSYDVEEQFKSTLRGCGYIVEE